ncbi:MAG TPA: PqqD family peptide modification chaperone [Afifellaceae bacterium]|nr:PqqD family peptide modification chaperone [Afifellaceae bacterium]
MAHYRFSDLPKPVDVDLPADMLAAIRALLPGWPIEPWHADDRPNPVLRFSAEKRKYSVTGPWVPEPMLRTDRVDATCGFIAELIRAYVNEIPERLCLHAASVEIGGRLVLFPSTHRAGKSVLSAALASAGCRLFGDDIVLIDPLDGTGISGGVCPRLRLPLPDKLQADTRSFIAANSGPTGKRYRYLTLGESALARKDERLPIGTFVMLERADTGPARLEPLDLADALKTVIWQNFARQEASTLILERLYAIVRRTGAYRLVYNRPEDAVRLLRERFAEWPDLAADVRDAEPVSPDLQRAAGPERHDGKPGFRRKAGVAELEIGGQTFLADNESGKISHLNQTASAIWHLLAEPMSRDEIVMLMSAAFPDVAPEAIAADVKTSLDILAAASLVELPAA